MSIDLLLLFEKSLCHKPLPLKVPAEMSSSHALDAADTAAEEGERVSWEGSDVYEDDIKWLTRTRLIPEGVTCRIPGNEAEPSLQPGKRMVFVTHFEHDFGLPESPFFQDFLTRFCLQPHHLPANTITMLSAYVSFSEGYLGL